MGRFEKFSFHKSRICRHAFHEHTKPEDIDDRAMQKWVRPETMPIGSGHISYALVASFPTDTLSTAIESEKRMVRWVPAAPAGLSTTVEFHFTREDWDALQKMAAAENRTIIDYTKLPNGEAFVVTSTWGTWNGEGFTFEAGFAPGKEYVISSRDPDNTGRPARLTMFSTPKAGEPMMVSEFGAYHVAKGTQFNEPMGRLNRDKVYLSSSKT